MGKWFDAPKFLTNQKQLAQPALTGNVLINIDPGGTFFAVVSRKTSVK